MKIEKTMIITITRTVLIISFFIIYPNSNPGNIFRALL